ncbi:MAG TPA: PEP/pyruvate-binding domain-containing protein, partial [Phycisphaerae bacterium]|nr:PEP/pyruvate-binding domain-containing protein [Phycisphaerae bacterium]
YRLFVEPCCRAARANGKMVVYFRFARHDPLLMEDSGAEIRELHPEQGFEQFIGEIHRVLDWTRDQGVHIFDCLSDLAVDWCSDRMLGNFFRLTCPYVYEVAGLAYFAVLKNRHSPHAIATIADTTQIFLDICRHQSRLYLHPTKVQQRHSPTMYMLHEWVGETFRPVTESVTIARIMNSIPFYGLGAARPQLGVWAQAFLEAEDAAKPRRPGKEQPESESQVVRRLLRMMFSREDRLLDLAQEYFSLSDVLRIWRRMIGTGLIGGKSAGMLLARAILKRANPRWEQLLEEHDSFYIGSDVFYTYLVQNGCWWIRARQRNPATFLEGAEEGRRRILTGTFSPEMQQEFAAMLDYFGQAPIIVRSSSLLEDAFGNSFAGKYESVFCVNQGPPNRRLEDFMTAVRTVYASAMSEKALRYREKRGLLDRDEQMSVLVQRVSGAMYGHLFFPQAAGVGLSYNPYPWNERIDPWAGMLRLVFGLGTRAVDRTDDDYTRVVALNAPELRPEAGFDQVRRYSQRKVDVLDLASNQIVSKDLVDLMAECPSTPVDFFASRDDAMERLAAETGKPVVFSWVLTFERLLEDTSFARDIRDMLKTIENAYGCPVDTEFTLNYVDRGRFRINLVQCRTLQVQAETGPAALPARIDQADLVFDARGTVVGQSRLVNIDRFVYVVPAVYGQLPMQDRYCVARLIGRLIHLDEQSGGVERVALLGPGRWGTTTPSLGVPVSYAEINRASVICEIVAMREGLVPEVSLGTHFFNELVEANVLYLALFPGRDGNFLNEAFFDSMPNRLESLLPGAANWSHVLRVIDAADIPERRRVRVNANNISQRVVCYLDRDGG